MSETGVIEIRIAEVGQLFNSLDPSPFPEKDLDQDAEDFIVSWATELPRHLRLKLRVHLSKPAADAAARIADGVHTYFRYRAEMSRRQLRRLLRTGRSAAIIGVVFLTGCLTAANVISPLAEHSTLWLLLRESMLIAGWVAMWRPMEIFLYAWWPIRHERRVYERLSVCDVEVLDAAG